MKRFERENGMQVVRFSGLEELVDAAYAGKFVNSSNRKKWEELQGRSPGRREDWSAGYDPARIKRELTMPPANSANVREIAAKIEFHNETQRKRRKLAYRREDGEELDADAWLRRDPNGWQRMEKTATVKSVLRIAINSAVRCDKRADDLFYRGAAAVALCDALENAGHSVEIVLFDGMRGLYETSTTDKQLMEIKIKESHAPLDVDTVALAVGEIGFYRRAIIPATLTCGTGKVRGNLGFPEALPDNVAQTFDVVFDVDVFTYQDALAVVKKFAAQFEAGPMSGRAG